jgi:hypothetical protein
VSTKKQNVDLFKRINEGYLHKVGADGRFNRDRLFEMIGAQVGPSGNPKLTDQQRKQMQALLEQELGIKLPKGVELDKNGNANEDVVNAGSVAKKVGIGAAIGGAALTGLGAAGIGPLSGLLGGGAAAAGGAGAAAGAAGAGAGAGAATTAAGVVGAGLKTADVVRDVLRAGGSALGDAADTASNNRGVKLAATMDAERLDQQRQMDRAQLTNNAWKAAQVANYQQAKDAGTAKFGKYGLSVDLPPLDPALVAARAAEAKRTIENDPGRFQPDASLLNPTGTERALGIGSTAATIAGAVPAGLWSKIGKLIGF